MGKLDKRISIVLNMSEERLRNLIREEVRWVLARGGWISPNPEDDLSYLPVTLSNPSAASRIPAVPFPEIKAEDVRKRIEELEAEDLQERIAESEAEAHRAAEVILDFGLVIRRLEKENAGLREELAKHLSLRIEDLKLRDRYGHGTRLQVLPGRVVTLVSQWENRIREVGRRGER